MELELIRFLNKLQTEFLRIEIASTCPNEADIRRIHSISYEQQLEIQTMKTKIYDRLYGEEVR